MKAKNNKPLKKIVSIITIVVLLANMLLYAFRVFDALTFWIIVAICAIIAFIVPRLK